MPSLSVLPAEVIALIVHDFSQRDLYQCSLVNSSFHTATTPFLWQTLRPHHEATTLVRCLTVHARPWVIHHVKAIDLQQCFTTNDQLLDIVTSIPHLKRLFLYTGSHINDTSFRLLPSFCTNLISLSLAGGSITRHSLEAIGRHCHQLRHLNLSSCVISTSATMAFPSSTVSALAKCTLLEKLSLGHFNDGGWLAVEEVMGDLSCFVGLTELAVWHGRSTFLHRVLTTQWPRLTRVRLDHAYGIGLSGFLETHPHITWLEIPYGKWTDTTLDTIMDALPRLTYLDVSHSPRIQHPGVRRLIMRCLLLTHLDLSSCHIALARFPELTPSTITAGNIQRGQPSRWYLAKLNKRTFHAIRGGEGADDDDDNSNKSDIRWWLPYRCVN